MLAQVLALHKERYVFPVSIRVSKSSGTGDDAIFMGVVRPLTDVPNMVQAWVTPEGEGEAHQRPLWARGCISKSTHVDLSASTLALAHRAGHCRWLYVNTQ